MNTYIILVKNGIFVPVDILSESASDEIKSLEEQGFIVAFESCRADNIEHALEVWQQQRDGTFTYDHILTSTTNSIGTQENISHHYGVVTATIVAGTNIFRDIFATVKDITGGTSGTYMSKLDQIKSQALIQLRKQADEMGGNAIIGISIDVDEISGGGKSMMMVTATGTVVVVH
ncbi:YbjQ family protein [Vibrio diabolicus]|uniref:YbjQ family protein n=1 Tax=Vibrio diabolicus TaxID=50719 RepID=UPI00211ABB88|nr:YbjQ family protein [Vibrio diabolicus]ELJ8761043.1 heavy metal-binding domain-containing protein [Vibrio parahaemolyticus]MCG6221575.1 YbjQ family protein [Vibrio diabolicus]